MKTEAEASRAEAGRGALAAVGCYLLWGFCPLFWALLDNVGSIEIIGQRIVWSLVLTVVACKFILKVDFVGLLRDARARRFLIPSGLLIMLNWSLYIVAMVTNNVVEASLGYYINPLASIVLGLVVFRERLTPLQIAATVLSAAGVIYFTVNYGSFPWIALVLAFTFGIYGAVKKRGGYPAVPTIAVEGIVALPFAIVALVAVSIAGQSVFFSPDMSLEAWQTRVLLVLTGPITAVPLILFARPRSRLSGSSSTSARRSAFFRAFSCSASRLPARMRYASRASGLVQCSSSWTQFASRFASGRGAHRLSLA